MVDVLGKPVGIGGLSAGRFQVCGLARYPGIDRLPQCLGTIRRRGKVGPVQPGNQGSFQCLPPFFGCVSAPKRKGDNSGAKSSCHHRHQPETAVKQQQSQSRAAIALLLQKLPPQCLKLGRRTLQRPADDIRLPGQLCRTEKCQHPVAAEQKQRCQACQGQKHQHRKKKAPQQGRIIGLL